MSFAETDIQQQFHQLMSEHGFSSDETAELLTAATPLELPTRHILVNQGENPTHFYFICKGICHASYLTPEGKEFSKEFYWEQDWIIGFESLIHRAPSPYLLESLTPVTLLCLPIEYLHQWRQRLHPLYIKLLEAQLMHKENKERFMLLYRPEQRYQVMCQQFPELIPRVSDTHIAAYLGITPISLSRIKARLRNE